eukprot:10426843-Karenia_brevis.AAC.1
MRPEVGKVEDEDDRSYQLQRGNHTLAPSQLRGGRNTGSKGRCDEMAGCVGQDLKSSSESVRPEECASPRPLPGWGWQAR